MIILFFLFIKHTHTTGIGHVALWYPALCIILVQAGPINFMSVEQALGDLYKKAFSFQPPIESFTAKLNSNYKENNNLTEIKYNLVY